MMYPWLENQFEQLTRRARENTLHHALLLQGVEGVGKSEFAHELATYILCKNKMKNGACGQCQSCHLVNAGSHPDFHQTQTEKQIGVDLIRENIQALSSTAQLSGAKVLIIYASDSMTESASNALLKTLEEPTANTFILLTASKKQDLLPTILSRCEKVLLQVPTVMVTQSWLIEQGITASPELIEMHCGAPLRVRNACAESNLFNYDEFVDIASKLSQHNPSDLANKWKDCTTEVVNGMKRWLISRSKTTTEYRDSLWSLYQQCISASIALRNPGINKVLLLSNLLIELQRIETHR